jgi:hypothetical protein
MSALRLERKGLADKPIGTQSRLIQFGRRRSRSGYRANFRQAFAGFADGEIVAVWQARDIRILLLVVCQ